MSLWEKATAELLDIIEWIDDSSDTLVWRFPRFDNEIKQGSQLIVRQSQVALFVDRGAIADVFTPGQYRLTTGNLPLLSTIMGWPYGFHSPFKAEVYFINTRQFTNLKWGTKNPLILRDPEFGAIRLRAFGTYVVRVSDPKKLVEQIVGTDGLFTLEGITEQLRNLIVSRFADTVGDSGLALLDLAAQYAELSTLLMNNVAPEFSEYGLEITKLLIENISLPQEVEEALDKKSSMEIIGNLDKFVKFQSAQAIETAAKNPGGAASAGVGLGMGFAIASQLGTAMNRTLNNDPSDNHGPPPLPESGTPVVYFIGSQGTRKGPYDLQTIISFLSNGAITSETLLWKHGMVAWQKADTFDELRALLLATPPPLP